MLILRTPEHFETPEVALWNVHDCWELSSMMIWVLTKPGAFSDDSESSEEHLAAGGDEPLLQGTTAPEDAESGDDDSLDDEFIEE